jgi:hypothetical protein
MISRIAAKIVAADPILCLQTHKSYISNHTAMSNGDGIHAFRALGEQLLSLQVFKMPASSEEAVPVPRSS